VPSYDARSNSPNVWHNGDKAKLNGNHVDNRFHENSMAVIRESPSRQRSVFTLLCDL